MKETGMIHIYCGDGKGKTTASMGLSVRAAGSGLKVLVVQFFKDGTSSELTILRELTKVTVMTEERNFGFFKFMKEEERAVAKQAYQDLLQKAILLSKEVDVLILDEIISTYSYEMIQRDTLVEFLKNKPNDLEVVLTGRDPKKELLELADYVTEMKKVKHPYDKNQPARLGIEY